MGTLYGTLEPLCLQDSVVDNTGNGHLGTGRSQQGLKCFSFEGRALENIYFFLPEYK